MDGELGLGNLKDASVPMCVTGFDSARSIASGQHHSLVVTKDGEVLSCGSSLHGKLGLPSYGLISVQKFTLVKLKVRVK